MTRGPLAANALKVPAVTVILCFLSYSRRKALSMIFTRTYGTQIIINVSPNCVKSVQSIFIKEVRRIVGTSIKIGTI